MDKMILSSKIKKLFKPYKKDIIMISIIMLLISIGSFLNPWITKQLIDVGIIGQNFNSTIRYVLMIIIVFLIEQLLELAQYHYYSNISIMIPYDLNLQASEHILSVRIKYFKDRNFSEVMSEIFQDISNISSLADSQFLTAFISLFKIVAGVIALLMINWKLTLIMLLTIPIKLLISKTMFKKQTSIFRRIMDAQTRYSAWLGDSINGIVEIKLWGIIDSKLNELKEILMYSNKEQKRLLFCGHMGKVSNSTLTIFFNCILYLIGAWLIKEKELTIGGLISFIAYSSLVFEPISIISYLITQLSGIIPAFERFSEFLNTETEEDSDDCISLPPSQINSIQFEDVSLVYDKEKVLEQLNFEILRGEKVAIIGSNGSGKTSIINLLLGFYIPLEGKIKINNIDIKSFKIESYRSIYSLMAQNNYLFNGCIYNNINLAKDLSDHDIVECCKQAGAYSFIQEFPDKLNTHVGYNGTKLSGGQRQKIALARTLGHKSSKILILDEATSSYDYHSEVNFNKTILSSNQYDITIVITHRPEILEMLDKIIYLDRGKIISIGSFNNIYKENEIFRNMINANLQEGK